MRNYQSRPRPQGAGGWGGPKKFGGARPFGAKKPWDRGGSDHRHEDRPMFQATCNACGEACQVPFKPVNGRPVFCRNCFKKDGDEKPARDFSPREFSPRQERQVERPRTDHSGEALKAINAKLDAIMDTLAAMTIPSAEVPVVPKKTTKKRATKKKV